KLRTILLNINNLNNGLVELNWNDDGFGSNVDYQIWRKEPVNFFDYLTSSSTENYTDTIKACHATFYYQIRVMSNGCESISSVRGGPFHDYTKPDVIVPKNASVDTATGEIVLSWLLPSIANADIKKYQIWLMNDDGGSTQFPMAEVQGYHNLAIRLNYDQVCDSTITFSITAQDSCGNSSVWNEDYFIRTLNMNAPEYNICNDECIISWDSIINWHDVDVEGVRIYRRRENSQFEVVKEVGPTEVQAFTYGYERGVKYEFYIEAYSANNSRTTTSCIKYIVGKKPTTTAYTWLRSASVIDGEVYLKWQVDHEAFIPEYAVSRSEDGANYEIIDTVRGSSDTIHSFIDVGSKYYQSPQYYKISPFDSCLNMGEASNHAVTIYTKVSPASDGNALIEWTPYESMSDLSYYHVYRIIDSLIYPFPIAEVSPISELSYIDDYSQAVPLTAKVGYLVDAVGWFSDSMPEQDTVRSNVNFLAKVTNLFVPSGFNPQGGVTQIFKPIYTGVKLRNYSFKILNRWGQIIFEVYQPVLGWDGKYLGEYVMSGAYVYVVNYETIYGKKMQKSGMFVVL
ncbi:MAG: hypothetical protein GQ527_01120, partial [Bacteroidales bacterium]|nr:hypothetical protein [Bacteroidales bacterium]